VKRTAKAAVPVPRAWDVSQCWFPVSPLAWVIFNARHSCVDAGKGPNRIWPLSGGTGDGFKVNCETPRRRQCENLKNQTKTSPGQGQESTPGQGHEPQGVLTVPVAPDVVDWRVEIGHVFGFGFLNFGGFAEIEKIGNTICHCAFSNILRFRNLLLRVARKPHIEDARVTPLFFLGGING
jgi:hypothetical protein